MMLKRTNLFLAHDVKRYPHMSWDMTLKGTNLVLDHDVKRSNWFSVSGARHPVIRSVDRARNFRGGPTLKNA
jgi:hypothetical protein